MKKSLIDVWHSVSIAVFIYAVTLKELNSYMNLDGQKEWGSRDEHSLTKTGPPSGTHIINPMSTTLLQNKFAVLEPET